MEKETIGGSKTESPDKRFTLDCREAGQGCSLTMSGTFEEVLEEGVEHGKRKHGMSGDTLRDEVKSYIKEDIPEAGGGFKGESRGAYPNLPS
jgi:predicted small metal-binding protein